MPFAPACFAKSAMSHNITLASCVQKLRGAKATVDASDDRLLEWLTDYSPSNSSDALQIVECLTICWEKNENLQIDARICISRAAIKQLVQSQESSQLFSMLIVLASRMLKWCEGGLSFSREQEKGVQSSKAIFGIEKVLQEVLTLTSAIFTNLENCMSLQEKEFLAGVETCICQFLDSLKIFCIYSQNNQLYEEFQRTAQELLSEALKVLLKLRTMFTSICGDKNFESPDCATLQCAHIISYGVSAFVDLGRFAVANGRDWVGLLNVAWKGVTALLQTSTGKEIMSNIIDIHQIITAMISCSQESLQNAVESWKMVMEEKNAVVNTAELKRLCIPVKFFLINVIRIVTHYPCQAVDAFNDIADCGLKITSLKHELSKHPCLKFAAEAIAETLEPSLFILLCTLLNSSELELSLKVQLLELLIGTEHEKGCFSTNAGYAGEIDEVSEGMAAVPVGQEASLQLGRLTIFVGLLQSSRDCGENVSFELAKRLNSSLQMISDAKVYAEMFQIQVSTAQFPAKATWQCLYITLLKSLEVFFVNLTGTAGWAEAEEFLYRNLLHPHTLCRELILDLWCFLSRHCEISMIEDHIQDLLLLLNHILDASYATHSEWPVRTIGRLICSLVKADPDPLVAKVYELALGSEPFAAASTSVVAAVLLKEHFPIASLPEKLKSLFVSSAKKALSELWNQIMNGFEEGCENLAATTFQLIDETLCCLLEYLNQEDFEHFVQLEELQWLANMTIDLLWESSKSSNRKLNCGIRSRSLKFLPVLCQKLQPNEIMSIIISLHDLVISKKLSKSDLKQIKLSLVEALAGFSEVSISEDETNPTSSALWELYHLILRERHWAFAHSALASFGYFASHTSWNELWRFVPPTAALAYDARTGEVANEHTFMTSLRCFLEREVVCATLIENDFEALQQEGEVQERALLEFIHAANKGCDLEAQEVLNLEVQGTLDHDHMELEPDVHMDSTESSLPRQIKQAMKMLQEGLLLLKEKLPMWLTESGQSLEQQHQMSDQLSLLTDVIGQLDVLQPSTINTV